MVWVCHIAVASVARGLLVNIVPCAWLKYLCLCHSSWVSICSRLVIGCHVCLLSCVSRMWVIPLAQLGLSACFAIEKHCWFSSAVHRCLMNFCCCLFLVRLAVPSSSFRKAWQWSFASCHILETVFGSMIGFVGARIGCVGHQQWCWAIALVERVCCHICIQ